MPCISETKAFCINFYVKFLLLVHLSCFIWLPDFALGAWMWKHGCPMGNQVQKLISNPVIISAERDAMKTETKGNNWFTHQSAYVEI